MSKRLDIQLGAVFGRLTVEEVEPTGRHRRALVRCECGNRKRVSVSSLGRYTNSCGCLAAEICGRSSRKHGMTNTSTWITWAGMIARCDHAGNSNYKDYGRRGIAVCERWRSFENFLSDMGERPTGMSIDRVNTNGNYEPGNCRWTTSAEQNRNRRSSALTHELVAQIRALAALGMGPAAIGRKIGKAAPTVRAVMSGRNWKDVA